MIWAHFKNEKRHITPKKVLNNETKRKMPVRKSKIKMGTTG
jgi:hypothetical protein